MKCEECGSRIEDTVCKSCGLVIDARPIAMNINGYPARKLDITTLYAAETHSWDHPLSPKIRKISRAFNPRYQKKYEDYVYVKAYEAISKICSSLRIPNLVKFEALNLFKGIRTLDKDFFKKNKLAPIYLACIKIACKINDYPIMNHDLADVIDYKINKTSKNLSYMEKKFNRAYREILSLYNLRIKTPEHPNFIDYACNKLNLPYEFVVDVHCDYVNHRRSFEPHFRLEGYILAII